MQEEVGAAIQFRHLLVAERGAHEAAGQDLRRELVDFVPERSVAGDDQGSVGHIGHRSHRLDDALAGFERAHHQHDRPIGRKAKLGLALRSRIESRRVDTVGNERRMPAFAVSLEVERIGADQSLAGEEAWLRSLLLCGPIAVLRDENMRRALAAARPAKRPVRIRIAAGHGYIGFGNGRQPGEAGGEGQLLVHELVAEERHLRPMFETLSRDGGDVDEIVRAVAPGFT